MAPFNVKTVALENCFLCPAECLYRRVKFQADFLRKKDAFYTVARVSPPLFIIAKEDFHTNHLAADRSRSSPKVLSPQYTLISSRDISLGPRYDHQLVGKPRETDPRGASVRKSINRGSSAWGHFIMSGEKPGVAQEAVFVESEVLPDDTPQVRGYDFTKDFNFDEFMSSYFTTGFQATNLGLAVEEINKMLSWTLNDEPIKEDDEIKDPEDRKKVKCKIFLGYTSNLISSGVREIIRFLVQNNLVSCIVSSAGGVEEDFIKCLAPTFLGDFALDGKNLRSRGLNRIGNLLVPNKNYCLFEEWIYPILDQMLKEQEENGTVWSPSSMIHRFGKEIDHPDSVYYWAYKNNIPVFCPAITDGSIGDMVYFHSYKNDEARLVIDIASDIRRINDLAMKALKTGIIILGGGLIKHHICNANLMRNGADFSVFINTGQEFDGSDSGARPDEAISWGKIRANAKAVKVYAEATLVFPLIVAATFAKYVKAQRE